VSALQIQENDWHSSRMDTFTGAPVTIPFEEIKKRLLADPEVRREYDALAPEFDALARSIAAKQTKRTKARSSRRILKTDPHLAPKR
jgi:hypothetical protein